MRKRADEEDVAPEAATQMADAAARLREKSWMIAPMTSGAVNTPPLTQDSAEAVLEAAESQQQ